MRCWRGYNALLTPFVFPVVRVLAGENCGLQERRCDDDAEDARQG